MPTNKMSAAARFGAWWNKDDGIVYDPAHVAFVIVACLSFMGVLFWLLWALLVCEGGIFSKIGPLASVVFTPKTLADYGYRGSPYALGVFEGWIVNAVALVLGFALIVFLHRIYHMRTLRDTSHLEKDK